MQEYAFIMIDNEVVLLKINGMNNAHSQYQLEAENEIYQVIIQMQKESQVDYTETYVGAITVRRKADDATYVSGLTGECGC